RAGEPGAAGDDVPPVAVQEHRVLAAGPADVDVASMALRTNLGGGAAGVEEDVRGTARGLRGDPGGGDAEAAGWQRVKPGGDSVGHRIRGAGVSALDSYRARADAGGEPLVLGERRNIARVVQGQAGQDDAVVTVGGEAAGTPQADPGGLVDVV